MICADASIIILAHNGVEFTRRNFKSILQASVYPKEFIFANNGSTDSTEELVEEYVPKFAAAGINFIYWTNEENLGCSLGRNQCWEKATTNYVLFMDNDTAVCTPDWLSRLVEIMDANPKLGVLGPKLIYPFVPHQIQCAGVAVNPMGRIRFRGRGTERTNSDYAQFEKVPVLISACWIKRREFLESIGGLDEFFHPVQYEDLDFCMKVNDSGYYCAYTPDVEIYHFEGKTTGSIGKSDYQRNIVKQSAKFRKRWNHVFKHYEEDPLDYRWLPDDELGLSDEIVLDMS
ncbi:MAG: glycosyltransferase family 2 protein [Lentisphaeria bacterium]|nr:glycosyltransferase family 2 protein [Lentisphaeria bacterium]NQZ70959.1 glycosyltransferase family 2 protein [Lentisphaeria bacterium]